MNWRRNPIPRLARARHHRLVTVAVRPERVRLTDMRAVLWAYQAHWRKKLMPAPVEGNAPIEIAWWPVSGTGGAATTIDWVYSGGYTTNSSGRWA